jgi:DNA-binding response OmpR family regulator
MAWLRVVVIEDNVDDAELIVRQLKVSGYEFDWQRVETSAAFSEAMSSGPDLILADYRLPAFDAVQALRIAREAGSDAPFIVVSGAIGEDTAVAMMRMGAADYVLKDRLARLGPAVDNALRDRALRREEHASAAALDDRVRQLILLQDATASLAVTFDPATVVRTVLRTASQLVDRARLGGGGTWYLVPEDGGFLAHDELSLTYGRKGTAVSETPTLREAVGNLRPATTLEPPAASMATRAADAPRWWTYVPVLVEGKVDGIIAVEHEQPGRTAASMSTPVVNLAGIAGLALNNAAIHEREKGVAKLLHNLVGHLVGLSGRTGLDAALHDATQAAQRLTEAQYAFAILLAPDGSGVEHRVQQGISPGQAAAIDGPPTCGGVLDRLAEAHETVRIDDVETSIWFLGWPEHHPHIRTLVGVPLSVAGRQLGVLAIADPPQRAFTPRDVMLVEGLASQLSLIVDNARLREIPSPLRAIAGGA